MGALKVMLLASLVSANAQAGSVLKVDLKESTGKTVPKELYYAQDGMMRIDSLDERGNVTGTTLVREGVVWKLDPRERTFTRIDAESLGHMFGGKESRMAGMLAQLPPEKRALIESRMAQMKQRAATTEYTFNDTGRSDKSGQYACRVWEERRSGRPFAEYCVVPTSSLPAGAELDAAMKKAIATADQIVSSVPQMAGQAEHLTRLGQLNGFPVRSRFGSEDNGDEHLLTSAEAQSLPADKFAIPKGYTEKQLGVHD